MVAVFDVDWDFGGTANTPTTPGGTSIGANLRFNNEDTNDQDSASPINIPSGADVFSFWKHIYLRCTTAPDTQVDNVRIYADAGLAWTGCTVNVGDGTQAKTNAASAGYDPGQALVLTTHDTIAAVTSLYTYTSGSPRTVTISETSSLIDAIGETSDYVVLSLTVANTAVSGTQAAETITWLYDEI